MRRILAALLVVALLLAVSAPAQAGSRSADIALGLAAFAVFNQVVAPVLASHGSYHRREVVNYTVLTPAQVVYATPAPVVYVTPAPVVVTPVAPPAQPTPPAQPIMVQYPHGRYELRLQGQQYVWVWIPTVPPIPPLPPPPAAPPAP